jgi:hypothetical protein
MRVLICGLISLLFTSCATSTSTIDRSGAGDSVQINSTRQKYQPPAYSRSKISKTGEDITYKGIPRAHSLLRTDINDIDVNTDSVKLKAKSVEFYFRQRDNFSETFHFKHQRTIIINNRILDEMYSSVRILACPLLKKGTKSISVQFDTFPAYSIKVINELKSDDFIILSFTDKNETARFITDCQTHTIVSVRFPGSSGDIERKFELSGFKKSYQYYIRELEEFVLK